VLSRKATPETRQRAAEQMAGAPGGAFLVASLIELQDAPVDMCNFYHGETGIFGLFTEVGAPTRNYYALLAFTQMLDTPRRVRAVGAVPGKLAIAAGTSAANAKAAVLVANRAGAENIRLSFENVPWEGVTAVEVRIVDGQHALEPLAGSALVSSELALNLRPPYVALVTLRSQTGR